MDMWILFTGFLLSEPLHGFRLAIFQAYNGPPRGKRPREGSFPLLDLKLSGR